MALLAMLGPIAAGLLGTTLPPSVCIHRRVRFRLVREQDNFVARLKVLEHSGVLLHKPHEVPTVPQWKLGCPVCIPAEEAERC